MDGTLLQALAFVMAGFVSGVFSGGLGIGGAAVATPLVRMLGMSPYLAVGTPVPMILPSTITGSATYLRAGLVDRKAALWTAPAAAVAAFGGALSTRAIDGTVLMLGCAAVLLVLAIRLFPPFDRGEDRRSGAAVAHPAGYFGLGAVTGFISGLLGVGGGFVMVPIFIKLFGIPTKQALGTSLAVIALTVLPNIVGHGIAGNVDWIAALLLCLGVVPGARLGASLAIRARVRTLRMVMAATLTIVALTYAGSELMKIMDA
jgi:uncharacterized membrane protein YfcA